MAEWMLVCTPAAHDRVLVMYVGKRNVLKTALPPNVCTSFPGSSILRACAFNTPTAWNVRIDCTLLFGVSPSALFCGTDQW